jgi:hypothetical protein
MQGSGVQNGADAKPAMSSTWADTWILNDQHLETPDEGLVATTFINSLGLSLGDEFYNSGIFLKGLSLDLPRVFHCHFSNVCQGISL